MYKGILAALAVLLLLASCGGSVSAPPDNPINSQVSEGWLAPYSHVETGKAAADTWLYGSYHLDATPDSFPWEDDYQAPPPHTWQYPWNGTWGGYGNSLFSPGDEWNMIFDYGDVHDNYNWARAKLVYGDYGAGDGWYMHLTILEDLFPGFPNGGFTPEANFYGFADYAVQFAGMNGSISRLAGKYDFKVDLTSQADGKVPPASYPLIQDDVYLSLSNGGKNGNVTFDPADYPNGFKVAIHATITYIEWIPPVYDAEGNLITAGYHQYYGDDTGWGLENPYKPVVMWDWADSDYQHVLNAAHPWNYLAYWNAYFVPNGAYPFPGTNNWRGWCTDPTFFGNGYLYAPVSCYDPVLVGTPAQSNNYDIISWIVNEMNNGDGSKWYHRYNKYANHQFPNNTCIFWVQRAIWHFKFGDGTDNPPYYSPAAPGDMINGCNAYTPEVAELIADAIANGDNYYPDEDGEYFAALTIPLDAGGNFWFYKSQINALEVDP